MAKSYVALETIQSLPKEDGRKSGKWLPERCFLASKPCARCGEMFTPFKKSGFVLTEKAFKRQKCCSQSCAKRLKNPMSNHQTRLKVSATLRERMHKPIKRGGNGQLLPLAQLAILHALGEGWESEVAVATGQPRGTGFPTAYKIDVAHKEKKIGIELDGGSHCTLERRSQDAKKMSFLASLGWSIYRVKNERALFLFSTFTSVDILLTSLMES